MSHCLHAANESHATYAQSMPLTAWRCNDPRPVTLGRLLLHSKVPQLHSWVPQGLLCPTMPPPSQGGRKSRHCVKVGAEGGA